MNVFDTFKYEEMKFTAGIAQRFYDHVAYTTSTLRGRIKKEKPNLDIKDVYYGEVLGTFAHLENLLKILPPVKEGGKHFVDDLIERLEENKK